jgi:hypothetical protein
MNSAIPYSIAYVPKVMSKKLEQHRYFAFNNRIPEWDLLYSEVKEALEKMREAHSERWWCGLGDYVSQIPTLRGAADAHDTLNESHWTVRGFQESYSITFPKGCRRRIQMLGCWG